MNRKFLFGILSILTLLFASPLSASAYYAQGESLLTGQPFTWYQGTVGSPTNAYTDNDPTTGTSLGYIYKAEKVFDTPVYISEFYYRIGLGGTFYIDATFDDGTTARITKTYTGLDADFITPVNYTKPVTKLTLYGDARYGINLYEIDAKRAG